MKNILKLFPYIRDQYLRIASIVASSIVIAALVAYQPQVFKGIIDTVTAKDSTLQWSDVSSSIGLLFVLSVTTIVASTFFNFASNRTFQSIRSNLRRRVFYRLTTLSADYFDTHRPGAIMRKTGGAIDSFAQWINTLNYSLLGPIFTIIFITIILFKTNLILGLLGIGIITFAMINFSYTRKRNLVDSRKWRKNGEESWAIFSETIQNMSTISALSSFDKFRKKLDQAENRAVISAFRVRARWNLANFRANLYNELSFLFAITVIIHELMQGRLSVGTFVVVIAYFNSLRNNASQFAQFIPDTDSTERDVERLVEVLETEPTFPDAAGAIPLDQLRSLEFRNVSFTYPDGKKGAVDNISFRIDGSRSVALVGPSGVGKSTITKLMLRFYAPTSGEILINDQPAGSFTHESVRRHIGMVMQDVALFNTTVKENLKLAREKATGADLQTAAEQAHAAEFIEELPKQYNTIVGERGVKLSGGQKQRIAIARAILKDPSLIILDEATSALDSESEKLVQDGLKRLMKDRLSLTIAHRLSTVRHADEILVLKKGIIAERGTHTELMKKPRGLYRKLFNLQSATGEINL